MIVFYSEDAAIQRECPDECEGCKVETLLPDSDKVGVLIERCVLTDVKKIWAQGIKTVCSCCGHGIQDRAFIVVNPDDSEKMKGLGYEEAQPRYPHCKDCGVFFRPKCFGKECK